MRTFFVVFFAPVMLIVILLLGSATAVSVALPSVPIILDRNIKNANTTSSSMAKDTPPPPPLPSPIIVIIIVNSTERKDPASVDIAVLFAAALAGIAMCLLWPASSNNILHWSTFATSSMFYFITTVLLSSILLVGHAPGVDAITYSTCSGNVLTLTGQSFGFSTFNLPSGCALTIDGGSATRLTFGAHTGLVLVIKNLDCGTVTDTSICIYFTGLTGGSIDINGVTRTVSSYIAANDLRLVYFYTISNVHTIIIKRVALTLGISDATNYCISITTVHFGSTAVSGSNSPGSIINVSENTIAGVARTTICSSVTVRMVYFRSVPLSKFETLEFSGNKMNSVTASSTGQCTLRLFHLWGGSVSLIGTSASAIVARNNEMKGNSVTSSGGSSVDFQDWYIESPVSGVSTLTIDGADMTNNTISTTGTVRFFALFFATSSFATSSLTMVHARTVTIKSVQMSGSGATPSLHNCLPSSNNVASLIETGNSLPAPSPTTCPTLPPPTTTATTVAPPTTLSPGNDSLAAEATNSGGGVDIAVIAGGAAGGAVLLFVVIVVSCYLRGGSGSGAAEKKHDFDFDTAVGTGGDAYGAPPPPICDNSAFAPAPPPPPAQGFHADGFYAAGCEVPPPPIYGDGR